MKILLIAPSSGHWRGLGKKRLFNGKTFRFSMLSLLTVAAFTPTKHQIRLLDEQIEDLPEDNDFDLVGITTMTATAPRAYEIRKHFRSKGIPVILGGFHPTFNIEEALLHASAVVVGPAGGAWKELLLDLEHNQLKKIYRGNPDIPIPYPLPKHLLNSSNYLSIHTAYATMGCRNKCSFCSITAFYNGKRYTREIDEVVSDLKSFDEKFFMFIDDNLTQDRDYILQLLQEIEPLEKKWVTQASVEIADDAELLRALQNAGCVGVFIGLESFSQSALCSQNKKIKSPEYYKDAIAKIHEHGIFVEAGLIFGFDTDEVNIFENTLSILEETDIDAIQASILTPLPGTELFRRMKDRIVDYNWEHYDYKYAVFNPEHMSREDLKAGLDWINKQFYAPKRIFHRLLRWIKIPSGYKNFYFPLYLNIAYWGRQFRFGVKGYNPAINK
ncbi:radical SAM protein [candidate division KSB1 bacterium]|nr:radical SAM protein [candidate division KSB1 bacterium]